jgi:hypothetical protein
MHPLRGAVAQLGERLNGIQEVSGSIPLSSTRNFKGLRQQSQPLFSCRNPSLHQICTKIISGNAPIPVDMPVFLIGYDMGDRIFPNGLSNSNSSLTGE